MRLTLPILLAYLEGRLDREQARRVELLVEEDVDAQGLLRRMRTLLEDPAAESTAARELDPELVADYLDGQLSREATLEFEQRWLAEPAHLAQVVASLQSVERRRHAGPLISRGRSFDLDSEEPGDSSTSRATLAELAAQREAEHAEGAVRYAIFGGLAVALLLGLIAGTSGWWWPRETKDVAASTDRERTPRRLSLPPVEPPAIAPATAAIVPAPAAETWAPEPQKPVEEPVMPAPVAPYRPRERAAVETVVARPATILPWPLAEPGDPPAGQILRAVPAAAARIEGEPGEPHPLRPEIFGPETTAPHAGTSPNATHSPLPEASIDRTLDAADIGQLISSHHLLTLFDVADRSWRRVEAQTQIHSGDILFAPPLHGSTVAIRGGPFIDLYPGTIVELSKTAEAVVARIWYGRLRLTATRNQQEVRLLAGTWETRIEFVHAGAVCGYEVRPFRLPGTDPQSTPTHQGLELIVLSDAVQLLSGPQPTQHIAPKRIVLVAEPNVQVSPDSPLPRWVQDNPPSIHDSSPAGTIMAEHVERTGELEAGLHELVGHRHPEVRHVAGLWLAGIGDFSAAAKELNDLESRSAWRDETLFALVDALARGRSWASRIEHALDVEYGPTGELLYRMLCGYEPESMGKPAGLELVANLDHDVFAVRLVAFWNLRQMTGVGLHYRPEMGVAERRSVITRWRERVARGGQLFREDAPLRR